MKPARLRLLILSLLALSLSLALTSCATNSAGQTWLRWWLLHGD